MVTVVINEKTKMGKNILEMLKALARSEADDSIKFLDETDYLFSSEANKKGLMESVAQVREGKKGKTIKTSELWK